jgi:hypothetical protein
MIERLLAPRGAIEDRGTTTSMGKMTKATRGTNGNLTGAGDTVVEVYQAAVVPKVIVERLVSLTGTIEADTIGIGVQVGVGQEMGRGIRGHHTINVVEGDLPVRVRYHGHVLREEKRKPPESGRDGLSHLRPL